MTISQILKRCCFSNSSFLSITQNEIELLLAFSLNSPIEFLYAHPDCVLTARQLKTFTSLIKRRCQNWPIAYLIGQKGFYEHSFFVSPAVLIPRPATEGIVDLIVRHPYAKKAGVKICDVGTGSGNIVISLAVKLKKADFYATDISSAALEVASSNARRYRLSRRIQFYRGALYFPLRRKPMDIIVANLPYLTNKQIRQSPTPEILHEPRVALAGGRNGFELIYKLLKYIAVDKLNPKVILLEIDPKQKKLLRKAAARFLPNFVVTFYPDYSGITRFGLLERL